MTTNQKYTDLINADIDGEIGDADKSVLTEFLAGDAEGRALHEELSSFCVSLSCGELESPPPHLKHIIMNSVKATRPVLDSPGFLQTMFAAPTLKYAATFSVGVFLTLSLVNSGQLSNSALDDITGLVGTISDPIDANLASSITVDTVEIAGKISLRTEGSMLILDFDLVAQGPIEALSPFVVGGTIVLAAYLIGLTYVAKQENLNELRNLWPLVFLVVPFAYASPLFATWNWGVLYYLALLAWVIYALSFLMGRAERNIPRAVVSLIAGISLLDGLLIATLPGHALWALPTVAAFALTLFFQKYVPGT